MSFPPAKHFWWPLRVGVASFITSLLTLVTDDDFNLVVSSGVFGVVVTIVATSDTLGATLATSWAIVGGACLGCILSALCIALFGTTVAAVLIANSLVGVMILYPKQFPVLAQKFAFGGSTIFVWSAYKGSDVRWLTLGIPLSTAIGALSAIVVTLFGRCAADDAVLDASKQCVQSACDALVDAVQAYAAVDFARREALRARMESECKAAEASLWKMKAAAVHAQWERRLVSVGKWALRCRKAGDTFENQSHPEAAASTLAEVTLHLRGMTLALDQVAQIQVQRWHLLHADRVQFDDDATGAMGDDTTTFAENAFAVKITETALIATHAMKATTKKGLDKDKDYSEREQVVTSLRGSLHRLDSELTKQRRKHYAPGGNASDAGETVARRALQASHLWLFNFTSLCDCLVQFLDDGEGEYGQENLDQTFELKASRGKDVILCEACGDEDDDFRKVPGLSLRQDGSIQRTSSPSRGSPRLLSESPSVARSPSARRSPSIINSLSISSPGSSRRLHGAAPAPLFNQSNPNGDTISALLRCDFSFNAPQLAYAVKLSGACLIAGWIGWATSGSGMWAAVTVAMVGTREGRAVGGSFNAALLRMQGTVVGAMFSFALVVAIRGDGVTGSTSDVLASIGRLLLLALFTLLTVYLRLNPEFAYAGIVAAFTAYIVALGIPDDADISAARAFAHGRVEQNLLGLFTLLFIEMCVFPVFAHTAVRDAAVESIRSAKTAAEVVYEATVGTECVRCRSRAAQDALYSLELIGEKVSTQKALLLQAAAEPHLWSAKFPLRPHQTLVTDLEDIQRTLGLMRKALKTMSSAGGGESASGFGASQLNSMDPTSKIAQLLQPTDFYVTDLRRAVKVRLATAANDLQTGYGHYTTRAASASIAKCQSKLERAFILHTLQLRESFRAGDSSNFLPNHLMVPWHAYMACTGILANAVESIGAASWDALLAVAKGEEHGHDETRDNSLHDTTSTPNAVSRRASQVQKREQYESEGSDELMGVRVQVDGREAVGMRL